MVTRPLVRWRTFGLSLGREFMRPGREVWPGFWYVQAFGVSLWRDTTPPATVGERGAW